LFVNRLFPGGFFVFLDKLTAYLDCACITPDNNACENAIRPFVIGRKNWLFNQSPDGAKSSCVMYALIETAKQNALYPRTQNYLTFFLNAALLPKHPKTGPLFSLGM
jgi:transposase